MLCKVTRKVAITSQAKYRFFPLFIQSINFWEIRIDDVTTRLSNKNNKKKETESKNKQLNVHSTQKLSSFFINLCKCVLCVLCFYVWSIRYKDAKFIIKLANKLNKLFLGIRCKSILIFETSTNRIFIVFDNKFIVIM